jgi:serine phosphatase RsbU (regulator of sigma subunit)
MLEIHEGDIIYLTTDGFIDQLGGPEEKKFGSKRFKELIQTYHNEPLNRQRALFNQEWREWKQDLEQIDDVTMIAIRFGETASG